MHWYLLLSSSLNFTIKKKSCPALLLTKCINSRRTESSASSSQWLHTDYNKTLKRTDTATEAPCLIALLLLGSISLYAYPISHTSTHKYICLLFRRLSQWGSKPPVCQLLWADELCSLNRQAPRGVPKEFTLVFHGNWDRFLVTGTEKNVHVQTQKAEPTETWEYSLVQRFHKLLAVYLGV